MRIGDSTMMHKSAQVIMDLGVPRRTAMPPLYRILWSLGISVRPPLYASFPGSVIFLGLLLAFMFGLLTHLVTRHPIDTKHVIVALCFGYILATFLHLQMARERRRRALPDWSVIMKRAMISDQEGERVVGGNRS